MVEFYLCYGSLVFLSNENCSVRRWSLVVEFNNGLIFSKNLLRDNELFEVWLDCKIGNWFGFWVIGVIIGDFSFMEIFFSLIGFKNGLWIMFGMFILKDGFFFVEEYGWDFDEFKEGDRVGVERKVYGSFYFFVNGVDLGVVVINIF